MVWSIAWNDDVKKYIVLNDAGAAVTDEFSILGGGSTEGKTKVAIAAEVNLPAGGLDPNKV